MKLNVPPHTKGSTTWRPGPSLPVVLIAPQMVGDPRGGVILTGGATDTYLSPFLYRLRHAGARWEMMTQQLKIANYFHVAFIIPDSLAPNCTLI